ncbi:hypothetical protein ACNR90_002614 [Candidozyma auris]
MPKIIKLTRSEAPLLEPATDHPDATTPMRPPRCLLACLFPLLTVLALHFVKGDLSLTFHEGVTNDVGFMPS